MIDYAVILAVNENNDQGQFVCERPIGMLPALGKPLVVRTMDRLYRLGIREYVVICGPNDAAMMRYLGATWHPDVRIEFVVLSPAGSLLQVLGKIANKRPVPFLLTSYNSFSQVNFIERLFKHYQQKGESLILSGALTALSQHRPYYAHVRNGRVQAIKAQKPEIGPELLLMKTAICGQNVVDYLRDLVPSIAQKKHRLVEFLHNYLDLGYPSYITESAWMLEIETDRDLLLLNRILLDEGDDASVLSEIPTGVKIVPPVRIDPDVTINLGATIGPYAYLESHCQISERAQVQNAIVLENALVWADEWVDDTIIVANRPVGV